MLGRLPTIVDAAKPQQRAYLHEDTVDSAWVRCRFTQILVFFVFRTIVWFAQYVSLFAWDRPVRLRHEQRILVVGYEIETLGYFRAP